MTVRRFLGVGLLLAAVVVSALALTYARFETRREFLVLQGLRAERDQLDLEWRGALLEQSTWETYSRIEPLARRELGMFIPGQRDVVVVRP